MKTIKPHVEPVGPLPSRESVYGLIEAAGRTCYLSERVEGDTAEKFIQRAIRRQHWSILEHEKVTLRITCDRGVTHELVRHRLASYSQESTRYCNYSHDKFGEEITVIDLATGFHYDLTQEKDRLKYEEWQQAMEDAERHYMRMLELGATPQEARSVLPNSTKTEIVVTMNMRSWRHFIEMRYFGVAGAPHPQMVEVAEMVYDLLDTEYPVLFKGLKKAY